MKTLLLTLAALATIPFGQVLAEARKPGDTKVYELRVYHANPGKLGALHARFRDHTVALFEKHRMEQLGYFVPVENGESNTLVYWLAYENEGARDDAWKAFRDDPDWKKAYADSTKDGKLISKVDSTLMLVTDYSPAVTPFVNKGDTRLFEWRTYTTDEGKLPNINARFRDHTCALFEKHGIKNLAYWNFMDHEEGAPITLTYLVAHPDAGARGDNFKAFSQDPDWKSAREASEKDGKILIKGGVRSVPLEPTDYSPVKG